MAYIARTNGGASVLELRVGSFDDIPQADQVNWREAVEVGALTADPYTEVRYISALNVVTPAEGPEYVQIVWDKLVLPAQYGQMRLKDYAAALRWNKTQAGVTLPNGIKIDTTESSKSKIGQALDVLEKGWAASLNWKAKTGWVTVDLAAMTGIAQAVVAYEQACFDAEKDIHAAIEAGTITMKSEIDAYPWP